MSRTGPDTNGARATEAGEASDTGARVPVDLTDLDLFAEGFPHEIFEELRQEKPVFFHEPTEHTPGGRGFWCVTRHADVVAAAGDAGTFSSERGPGQDGGGTLIEDLPHGSISGVLFNMMDDPRHRRIRHLVMPFVAPKAVARLESGLRERAIALLESAADRGRVDFLTEVAAELPLQAIAFLMGIRQEDRHFLLDWADATLDYQDRELGQPSQRQQEVQARMFEYGAALVAEKRATPGDDILSVVANAVIEDDDGTSGPLTDAEVMMFFNLLVAAGSETTRNSIALGLEMLIENPGEAQRLRADPTLMAPAVEEMLRRASTTAYNRRTATRRTELGGQEIAPGDKAVLWWASANHDAEVFPDPYRFDVSRHPNPHVAFGHGVHFCLGANLARLEMRIVFEELLARFGTIERDGDLEWVRSNKHTGLRHMPVVLAR